MKKSPDPAAGASAGEVPAAGSSAASSKAAGRASTRPANDLSTAVRQLLNGSLRQLDSAGLRDALRDLYEFWLTTKAAEIGVTSTSGFAIVATGGLGRGELAPYSDLDLTLVHDDMPADVVAGVAESLWYPLWDANIRLDHSVRTVPEALTVANEDISAGLAMLEARHIAGDAELSGLLIGGARRQWRTGIASRFDALVAETEARWQRSGQIAHRAEPDLKSGRGGLRDVQLLNALAIAQLADVYPSQSLASPTGSLGGAHLALLRCEAKTMAEVTAFLEQAIEQAGNPANGLALHGPLPAPMPRRAGYQRAQVLIEASQRKRMQAFLPEWLARVKQLAPAQIWKAIGLRDADTLDRMQKYRGIADRILFVGRVPHQAVERLLR